MVFSQAYEWLKPFQISPTNYNIKKTGYPGSANSKISLNKELRKRVLIAMSDIVSHKIHKALKVRLYPSEKQKVIYGILQLKKISVYCFQRYMDIVIVGYINGRLLGS